MTKCNNCRAYVLRDGKLVCQSCGEPSPSERWRGNVYGQQQQAATATARRGGRR